MASAEHSTRLSAVAPNTSPHSGTALRSGTRDHAIDVARGIAMVLVVLGHNRSFAAVCPTAVKIIFLFHVPAFFFISGYLLRPARIDFAKTARRILAPFGVVGFVLAVIKSLARGGDVWLACLGLLWATGATLASSQLWFLPTLFLTLLGSQLVARALEHTHSALKKSGAIIAIIVCGYGALQLPAPAFEMVRWPGVPGPLGYPWSLDLVPISMFFTLCGFFARKLEDVRRVPSYALLLLVGLVAASFMMGARTDLNLRVMTPFPIAMVAALAGAIGTLIVGRLCAPGWLITQALQLIGIHSLFILTLHILFENFVLDSILKAGSGTGVVLSSILASVVAGLVGPILISYWFDRLTKRAVAERT